MVATFDIGQLLVSGQLVDIGLLLVSGQQRCPMFSWWRGYLIYLFLVVLLFG
jgi:hypothetical protein